VRICCLALLLFFWASACSTLTKEDVAQREDYAASVHEFQRGDIKDASALFPRKEKGSFITTIEKYWLDLLNGRRPDPKPLLAIAAKLEDLQTVRLSKELGSLLYRENTGSYYPSEHEAVVLHMILAMGFLDAQKGNEARVELRRASRYLQSQYAPNRKPFDDPALRVWLAALWMAAGEWGDARVDLRVASQLAPNVAWLKSLAALETPPPALHLVFAGAGPTLSWEPFSGAAPNPLASLKFHPSSQPQKISLAGGQTFPPPLPTIAWFDHHQQKNAALYEAFQGSRYVGEGLATTAVSSANFIGATLVSGVTLVAGIGGGIAVAVAVGKDLGAGLGAAIALTGFQASRNLYSEAQKRSKKWLEEGLGEIEYYRYVRFLPDFIYVLPGQQGPAELMFANHGKRPFMQLQTSGRSGTLYLYQANTPPATNLKVDEVPAHLPVPGGSLIVYNRPASYAAAEELCQRFVYQGAHATLSLERDKEGVVVDEWTRMLYPKDIWERFETFSTARMDQPFSVVCKLDRILAPEIRTFEGKLRNQSSSGPK
jgi:hypothetical protein